MKTIIVGAGRIGRNLAKSLSDEDNEVYLIERNEKIVQKNIDKLDVKLIVGNGADPDILSFGDGENGGFTLRQADQILFFPGFGGTRGYLSQVEDDGLLHRWVLPHSRLFLRFMSGRFLFISRSSSTSFAPSGSSLRSRR